MNPMLRFTSLGRDLTALLDDAKTLDIDETHEHLEDGSLFRWLKEEFGDDVDISAYESADQAVVLELFAGMSNAIDSKRKLGVEHNGLALLLAYCFEGIQKMALGLL